MNEIQTITDIRDVKNKIKKGIKTINTADYAGQKFGNEQEYTYEGLLDGVDSLLTDVTTLIKAPVRFLKLSTYEERREIFDTLNGIQIYLDDIQIYNNPRDLHQYLDKLKQAIRPFHIRYTKERLIEFDNELSELTRQKQEFSKSLDDLKSMVENKGEVDEMLISLQEKNTELENDVNTGRKRLDALNDNLHNVEDSAEQISEIKNQSNNHKELIDNFVEKIVNREQELENQTVKTETFNKKLKKFTDERDELLKTAKNLIEEAKTALGYKKAEGISSAFQTQLEKRDDGKMWLWFAGAFILIAIALTAWFISINQSTDLNTTLARISIISLPFAGAWFCAGQYTKLKNIAEDYAYKTMLAQSIIGFSEQLKDKGDNDDNDEAYKTYIKKMLDEIHQHPLKNHKKQEAANPYKKLLDNLKDLISKNDTPP
ncbi:hypothetical protein BAZOLSSOX_1277 [uncultured Gammaproteobacteria bacterium]|nr:hypothetical protein BAZOLSSOX_1277 [uncultured Gammaproteobacteria bacterium]